jgi:chemotaxis protein histidine kinase CheA
MSFDDDLQSLLQEMRAGFLDYLQERCDECDNLLVSLEKNPRDVDAFDKLYRAVHSLKGAGGTYGLNIVTHICHQLENCLNDIRKPNKQKTMLEQSFEYLDLLRRVDTEGRKDHPDYAPIEAALADVRRAALESRKSCLLAETSAMMLGIYQKSLNDRHAEYTVAKDGLEALSRLLHEPFDLVILGRELPELNGVAVAAALRESHSRNQNVPVFLVTSNADNLPPAAGFTAILPRNQQLAANLEAELQKLKW